MKRLTNKELESMRGGQQCYSNTGDTYYDIGKTIGLFFRNGMQCIADWWVGV